MKKSNQLSISKESSLPLLCKASHNKGPLLQVNKSATLSTFQDQTLFQPVQQDSPIGVDHHDDDITGDVAHKDASDNVPAIFAVSRVGYNGGEKANFAFAVNEDVSPTIEAVGPPAVAKPEIKVFGICGKTSFSMESDNPRVGFYEATTSKTLDRNCCNPTCNQGGIAVVAPSFSLQGSMIGREEKNGPAGSGVDKEISFTLNTVDRHAVCATTGSRMSVSEDVASTLCARDWKDPPTILSEGSRLLSAPGFRDFLTGGAMIWRSPIQVPKRWSFGKMCGRLGGRPQDPTASRRPRSRFGNGSQTLTLTMPPMLCGGTGSPCRVPILC